MADPIKASNAPAFVDLNDLDGPKMVRETVCVAQVAIGNFYGDKPDMRRHIDRLSRLADACDVHRPLGPDGKHGTTRCTPTCGCIDKRTESDVAEKQAPIKASIEVEIDPTPTLLTWNVGQDDPHDHFPWTWTPDVDQKAGDPVLGHITTPNGRRPDGSMHTFWGITYGVWEPQGRLICALVNRWAHETFGTALPDPVAAPSPPWSLGWVDADGNPVLDDLSRDDVEAWVDLWASDALRESDAAEWRVRVLLARALRKQLEADQ